MSGSSKRRHVLEVASRSERQEEYQPRGLLLLNFDLVAFCTLLPSSIGVITVIDILTPFICREMVATMHATRTSVSKQILTGRQLHQS